MREEPLVGIEVDGQGVDGLVITLKSADGEVAGVVADATGGGVEGARITARETDTGEVVALAFSDDMGGFSLGVGSASLEVTAEADAYSRSTQSVEPPTTALTLVMVPASEISGQVIEGATGEPLQGVRVTADGLNGLRHRATTQTESDGEFRLSSLPAGGYQISAIADDWRSDPVWVSIALGQKSEPIVLEAKPGFALTGTISLEGELCRSGRISVSGPVASSGSTDAQGTTTIRGLSPGRYHVDVRCEPGFPIEEVIEIDRAIERRWDLSLGLTVRGRVESASGRPIMGARIGVQPLGDPVVLAAVREEPKHWLVQCVSDSQGEFLCRGVTEGRQQCSLLDRRAPSVEVTTTTSSSPRVVLRAAASGTIRATIASAAREPLPEQIAFVEDDAGRLTRGRRERNAFAFEHLPLGEYRLFLGPPGVEPEPHGITLREDGQVVDVALSPPATTTVSGRVVDDRQQPVLDAWVRAFFAESVSEEARAAGVPVLTDERGWFQIDGVAPGRYDLKATSHFGETTLLDVAGGASSVVMRLPNYGSLEGSVVASNGAPVTAFDLEYVGKDRPGGRVRGSGGRWALPWLAPGEYAISVDADEGFVAEALTLMAGEHRTLALRLNDAAERTAPQ